MTDRWEELVGFSIIVSLLLSIAGAIVSVLGSPNWVFLLGPAAALLIFTAIIVYFSAIYRWYNGGSPG